MGVVLLMKRPTPKPPKDRQPVEIANVRIVEDDATAAAPADDNAPRQVAHVAPDTDRA